MSNPYILKFTQRASENLARLDKEIATRILSKLQWLATNVADLQHKSLTGQWSGYYSLRVGSYRAIYRVEHNERLIVVESIGHRREVYDE